MRQDWWKEAVVYQIYTRSFFDSNGDGVGDLDGVIAKLDYLASLSVDAIWLSPLHPTPNIDYGYDGTDYFDVAPEQGTLATFDRLIAEARSRGIAVLMDLVMDYTSSAHPWFVQARSSRSSAYHDWYVWADSPPDCPPNNWPAFFSSGSAWTFDPSTRHWYLHYFAPEQPELNWANPQVRKAMHRVMRFWLDRGVAGFRLDVISFLSKPLGFGDMPNDAAGAAGRFYANGPRLHEYLREMRSEVFDHYPGMLTIGEGFGLTGDQAIDFVDPERGALNLIFLFDISALTFAETGDRQLPNPADVRATLMRWDQMLVPRGAWPTLFLGNHDVARMVTRFGSEHPEHRAASAKLLLTLLMTVRGTPVIYQGDEIGMVNPGFTQLEDFRDVAVTNAWRLAAPNDRTALLERLGRTGRDNGRTPVQWSSQRSAGFTTGEPWIGTAKDYAAWNVAAQEAEPGSVLAYWRQLSQLRRDCPALRRGEQIWLETGDERILAFERRMGDECLRIVLNWSDRAAEFDLGPARRSTDQLLSNGARQVSGESQLRLEPYACSISRVQP
jgi:oligo-1,6-glucosidase